MRMRNNPAPAPGYEAELAPQIARALARYTREDEFEAGGITFQFDIETRPEETETCYTGVSYMGACESYVRTTHRARIKFIGAYRIPRIRPVWAQDDPYWDDPVDVAVNLDMNLLTTLIEAEADEENEYAVMPAA